MVDDVDGNLVAIRSILDELNLEIVEARTGREALRVLLDRDFSLILLDVQMPDIDGFETARLIRSRERSRSTPIIFVTAHAHDDGKVLEGYDLGAVDFLFKPIRPEILRGKVQVFVDLHRRTLEAQRQARLIGELERAASRRRLTAERQRWEAERLRDENRNKDEFLAVLAHELRNPLSPIRTGLALLGSGALDAERRGTVLESMQRQLGHLVRLVDDLMDVARISQGKILLQRKEVDLRELIDQAVEAQREHVTAKEQTIEVACPEGVHLFADDVRLLQVLQNLISNASRYSPAGCWIRVEGEATAEHARMRVIDNGKGIAPHLLDEVFDLFVQERTGGAGLGLGLSLVRSLVELHSGTITAHSEGAGHGSTFEVTIPRKLASIPDEERSTEPVRTQIPSPGAPLRVAVIDDNPDVREATATLMEVQGHRVFRAGRGDDGFDLVVRERPDVALIDIDMPGMTGDRLAIALRERFGDDTPLLVALTGHGDAATALEQAGFDRHLMKPAEPAELLRAIRRDHAPAQDEVD